MKKFFITLAFVFCCFIQSVNAEETPDINLNKANKQLDTIETSLNNGKADSQTINESLKTVNALQADMNTAKNTYNDKLQNAMKKLAALGEPPAAGVKEAPEIAAKRKEFSAEEEKYKSLIAQIELINTKIDEINSLALKVRNQSLLNRILVRDTSIFQFKALGSAFAGFAVFIYNILKSPYEWYTGLNAGQQKTVQDNIGYAAVILAAVLAAAIYLSLYIRRRFGYRDCTENPTYGQKITAAIAMAIAFGVIPAAVLGAFLLWLSDNQTINNGNLGRLLFLAVLYTLYFFLIRAAVKVVFVPRCGFWRIVNMEDKKAKSVSRALVFSAAAILLAEFLLKFAAETKSSAEIIYVLQVIAIAAKAFSIIIITRRLLYNPSDELEPAADSENYTLSNGAKISLGVTVFIGLAFLLSLAGYVRLADYIIDRFIYTGLILAVYWIIDKLIRIMVHQILRFRLWTRTLHINPRFLVKTEFWFGIILTPVLWIAAIITILGVWGVSVDIILHDIKNFLLGFNIGGMHISIVSLIMGVLTFMVSMFVFKSLKRSLLFGNLSKIDMEEDSRNSLAAGISLIGFIVSIFIAFAVMGGSLSSITIIAGALSFGVGLGLQNIVSNFVSGIIIIFERPIKIGDWVVIKGQEGIVKSISMRATLLEAFNKSDIIIPNSDILSSSLVNMTYSNRIGRIEIKIGVNYNSNVKMVQTRLMDIATATAGVLSNPAPSIAFVDFAENSLIFQLNCFTANVYNRQTIANQLRESILSAFAGDGIIPTPQKMVQIISPSVDDNEPVEKNLINSGKSGLESANDPSESQ